MNDPNALMHQVNTQRFFQGLPERPPFVAQIPLVNPRMTEMLPYITGCVLAELQAGATKNPIRAQLYLSCAENWNGPTFHQIILGVSELADLFMTQQRMQPGEAIQLAASKMVTVVGVQLAMQSGLLSMLPNLQQSSQERLNEMNYLAQQLNQMYQARNAPGNAMGGFVAPMNQMGGGYPNQGHMPPMGVPMGNSGYPNTGMGGYPQPNVGMPMGGGYQLPMNPNMGMLPNNTYPNPGMGAGMSRNNAMAGILTDRPSPTMPQFQATSNPPRVPMAMGASRQTPPNRPSKPPIEEAPYMYEKRPAPKAGVFKPMPNRTPSQTHFAPAPQPAHVPVSEVVSPQPISAPLVQHEETYDALPGVLDVPAHEYDRIVLTDGSVVVPAALHPELKPTLDERQPYRKVYDGSKYALFYVQTPQGKVYEILQPRDANMDYMKNELDERTKTSIRNAEAVVSDKVIQPDWSLVAKFKPHPTLPISAQEFLEDSLPVPTPTVEGEDVVEVPEVEIGEQMEVVSSFYDATFRAAFLAGESVDDGKAFETYFLVGSGKLVVPKDADPRGMISSLNTLDTFAGIKMQLEVIRDQGSFGMGEARMDAFNVVDQLLTDAVNRKLKRAFSLDNWSIESFCGDIDELLSMLRKDYGDRLVELFEGTAGEVSAELNIETAKRVCKIGPTCALLWVPWNSGDMALDLNNGGMIPEEEMPELYETAKTLVERTSDYNRHFILTVDDVLLEVTIGELAENCYVLHQQDITMAPF